MELHNPYPRTDIITARNFITEEELYQLMHEVEEELQREGEFDLFVCNLEYDYVLFEPLSTIKSIY